MKNDSDALYVDTDVLYHNNHNNNDNNNLQPDYCLTVLFDLTLLTKLFKKLLFILIKFSLGD